MHDSTSEMQDIHAVPSRRAHKPRPELVFWLACFIAPIAILCLVCIWNGVYPFGAESFLTEDLKYQYVDFYTWFRGVLTGGNNLFYSFSQSLGSNTWGLYSYYLASPLNALVVLFDQAHIVLFVFVLTAIKLGLIQMGCARFLRKRFNLEAGWTFLLSLSFAWCGWIVTQMRNPIWLDALALLPWGCLACWRLIREGRIRGVAAVVTLDIIICWYMAYISILFFCLYVLFELAVFACEGNRVDRRFVCGRAVRFTGAMLLALALSAWSFVPTVLAMAGGTITTDMGPMLRTTLSGLVEGFLPNAYQLNVTPQFYAGTIALIGALLFLLEGRIRPALRLIALAFIALLVASSLFSPLEYVWCGMRVPNGFYSRTAFLAAFMVIWAAAYGIATRRKPRMEAAGACTPPSGARRPNITFRPLQPALAGVLSAFIAVELLVNAHISWRQLYADYPQASYEAYVDEAERQLDELHSYDASAFYRIDKTYTRAGGAALNEGLAQGFRQLSSYSSANNPRAVSFLNRMGYSSEGEFSTRFSASNLVMDSLLGVKYVSTDVRPVGYEDTGLSSVSNGARFWRNPYALGIGYAIHGEVAGSTVSDEENPFERQNAMFRAITGCSEDLWSPIDAVEERSDGSSFAWSIQLPAGTVGATYVIKPEGTDRYQSVALTIDDGATVQEAWRFDHNVRFFGSMDGNGPDTHTVRLSPWNPDETLPEGTTCVFYSMNVDLFEREMARLAEHQFEPTVFRDGFVQGVYETDADGELLLSIPYDAGWTITVNGDPVQASSAFDGGMMSLHVRQGENAIEMRYLPPGLVPGCIVSGATAAGLGLRYLWRRQHRQRIRNKG